MPLPEFCARAPEERRDPQEPEPKTTAAHRNQAPDQELVFSAEHGGTTDPVGFSRPFDRLVKRTAVRRITVRPARRTRGALFAFLELRPEVAQAVLRHSRISMTTDVYTHVVGEDAREAVAMLAELLEDPLLG